MTIICVPNDQPTIQAGVNAANPGDVVLVKCGFYRDSVVVEKNSIRIIAEEKHGVTLEANNRGENPFSLLDVTDVEIFGFVIQNSLRGVWVYLGGFHRIIGNVMQNSGEGILLENSTGNFMYQNTIRNNDSDGVIFGWFPGSSNNWLVENEIIENGGDGVDGWTATATGNAFINNKSVCNAQDGFVVRGQNTLVYGNHAEGNTFNGILIADGNNSVAVNNNVKNNKYDGIEISSQSNIAYGNEVEGNCQSGIEVNGNLNIVQDNDVEENHDDGIEINGNDNSIFGNELEDNTPQNIDNNGTNNNIFDNDND
ncbi:right-handed parallel beta-helix repeat-containing protein [Heyndrickxia sp. MSNUG]|uniref:right-handed parallel beta-helix repeat-containing protein n=1 Tax=Heyndrickxia sp. MSNUG TaxID=3136677 RepID=UPI003C2DB28A